MNMSRLKKKLLHNYKTQHTHKPIKIYSNLEAWVFCLKSLASFSGNCFLWVLLQSELSHQLIFCSVGTKKKILLTA